MKQLQFIHTALVCSSEKNSDKFYHNLLGLKKVKTSYCPSSIINKISPINNDLQVIVYGDESLVLEIFIDPDVNNKNNLIHICLKTKNREDFLSRCIKFGIEPIKIQKGENFIYFVSDYDNNLLEIK